MMTFFSSVGTREGRLNTLGRAVKPGLPHPIQPPSIRRMSLANDHSLFEWTLAWARHAQAQQALVRARIGSQSPTEIVACEHALDMVCTLLGDTAGGELGDRLSESLRTYSHRMSSLLANFSKSDPSLDTLQRQWTVGAKDVAMALSQIVASRSLVRRPSDMNAAQLYKRWIEPMQILVLEQAMARAALRYADESQHSQELIVHCVGTVATDFARHCPPMAEQTRKLLSRARQNSGT